MREETIRRLDDFEEDLADLKEQVELAADGELPPDEVQEAKEAWADLVLRIETFLAELRSEERSMAQRQIGVKMDQIRGQLVRLEELNLR